MRVHTSGVIRTEYPDAYAYAFNPMPLVVSGLTTGERVTLTIDGKIDMTATAYNSKAYFDIAPVVQSLFVTEQLSRLTTGQVTYAASTSIKISGYMAKTGLQFGCCVVWGALQTDIGTLLSGDYNADYSSDFSVTMVRAREDAVWHYGLPFTLSLPTMMDDTVKYSVDGGAVQTLIAKCSTDCITNVDIPKLTQGLVVDQQIKVFLYKGTTLRKTYSVSINYDTCDKIYLRWIDKKGYYCYWAFSKASDEHTAENDGVYIQSFDRATHYVDGFNGGDGRWSGKKNKRSITVAASLVDASTWDYLLGVTQSPVVDMYTENDYLGNPRWLKVNVEPGRAAKERGTLSDFMAVISLDQINNQRL